MAVQLPSGRPTSIVGSASRSNSPANARSKSSAEPVGVERGEEADLAEVDREHGDAGAGELAQRGQDRPVAAEHDAEVGVGVVMSRRARSPPPARGRACAISSASNTSVAPARRAAAMSSPSASAEPPLRRRWVITTALTRRPRRAARRRRRPRGRPPPATRTSRGCPPGPGRPEEAKPSTAAPSSCPQAATAPSAARRASGSRTTPPRLHVLAPRLELRLDHRERVEALRGARPARPGAPCAAR